MIAGSVHTHTGSKASFYTLKSAGVTMYQVHKDSCC